MASLKLDAQENLWIAEIGTWGDSVNASVTYDHCCFKGFYVGAGAGLTWNFAYPVSYQVNGTIGQTYNSRALVPVYADVKYYLGQKKICPFIDLKGGLLSDYTHKEVGFFVRPALGLNIKKTGINPHTTPLKIYTTLDRKVQNTLNKLENGEIKLDEAFKMFEEGIKYAKICENKLSDIEEKVAKILKDGNKEDFIEE